MSRFELPEDWVKGLLEQAVTVKSGVGFPHKFQGKLTGDFPVYKVGDLSKAVLENNGYLCRAGNYVNTDEISQLKGEVFPKGSTLFAKIGEAVKLNRRAYVEVEGLADNNVMSVVPVIEQSKRFIYYFLKTVDLTDVSRSTTVPSIRKGDIEQLPINWPSLAEQKVIADKLDTLLAQVESIKARLERIPEILKQFRQSVLAAAVSGKLTEEWREANSKVFGEVKPLSFAGKVIAGQSPSRSEVNLEGKGEPYVTGPEQWDGSKLLHHKWTEHPKRIAPEGSIFVTVKGAGVGTTFPGSYAAIGRDIYAFVPNENMNYAYILFAIQASAKEVVLKAKGLIPGLTKSDIVDHEVYLPSIDEQAEIARLVEEFFAFADHIEKQVCAALARVNNLTQSILAKAFRGELTAEWREANPELISGKNSAEALLERIKAERESAKPTTKRGRAET